MRSRLQPQYSWGQHQVAVAEAFRPERLSQLRSCIASATSATGLLPIGAGRSYGDVGLNHKGQIVLTDRLDRMLSYDPQTQLLTCEPGVRLASIMAAFLPKGLGLPVTPGTAFATVAGAVANNIHGKNHHQVGAFSEHVVSLTLRLADQSLQIVSPQQQPDLFWATCGGLGLTGLIEQVCLRLVPITNTVSVTRKRMACLEDFCQYFATESQQDSAHYSVGWLDCMATGHQLGRGVLATAYPMHLPQQFDDDFERRKLHLPFNFPTGLLNRWSLRCFNQAYFHATPRQGQTFNQSTMQFLYPLDQLLHWNRLYGKHGFYQFQCVLSHKHAIPGFQQMLASITKAGQGSFLAVIKGLGAASQGPLSFPMPGVTLALDFPKNATSASLIRHLNQLTCKYHGRVYLAKDALLDRAQFEQMYPQISQFKALRAAVDPQGLWQSNMGRRLGLC